jgi:SAM-dependent methyltransferase
MANHNNRGIKHTLMGEIFKRIEGCPGRDMLEIGCGEGMMFAESSINPVQMDVSAIRLERARGKGRWLICADAYELPFADASFQIVLLVAVLEHTRRPWQILAEAHRVLGPGGRVIIVVPNDLTMSLGRVLLFKFPPRYPDHLTFMTPRRIPKWLAGRFEICEGFPLPFRRLAFALNLYYFVVAQKC